MSPQTSHTTEILLPAAPFVVAPILDGDVLTVVIDGELDIATAPLLEEALRSFRGMYRSLRYDLGGLDFMDSAGLRALLGPASSKVPISDISVTNPTRAVRRLLELRDLRGMIGD